MMLLCTYELCNYISYQVENCENNSKTVKIILFSQQTVKIIAKTMKIKLFSQQTVK